MVCGWLMRVCVVRLLGFSRLPWCCTVNAPIYIYTVAQCWWLVKAVCICVIGVIIVFLGWLSNIHRILPASSLIYIISYTFEKCTEWIQFITTRLLFVFSHFQRFYLFAQCDYSREMRMSLGFMFYLFRCASNSMDHVICQTTNK